MAAPFVVTTIDDVAGAELRTEDGNVFPIATSTLAAIDTPNTGEQLDPGQAAAANITIPGPTITKARSGKVLVIVSASIVGSVATAGLVLVLHRDGAPIAGSPSIDATNAAIGSSNAMSLAWIDTLPDAAAHTYSAEAIAGVGTVSTVASESGIIAIEL